MRHRAIAVSKAVVIVGLLSASVSHVQGENRPINAERSTTIHGRARTNTFPVARVNATYRGEVVIKQRDFGIEPIKVAGGTVKVKDELRVQFEIVR